MKKIIGQIIVFIAVVIVGIFFFFGKDDYDPNKFYVECENLKAGGKISFKLPDQFGNSIELDNNAKIVILTFKKATGHIVKEYLNKKPKSFLESKNAFFVADISPMPVVIRNSLALPDLRKSPYHVLLIYDKKLAQKLKNKKNYKK